MGDTIISIEDEHKAVAYAVTHKDEMIEEIKKFINDLYEYETAGNQLNAAKQDAIKSIKQIDEKIANLFGSIEAVIKIIVRALGPEKVSELASKYTPEIKE